MAVLGAVASAISGVASIFSGVKSLTGGSQDKNERASQPVEAKPEVMQEDAKKTAIEEMKKRRKASLLTGGQTDITGGKGIVGVQNVGTKQLLGQ